MARSKSSATPTKIGRAERPSNLRLDAFSLKLSKFQQELFDSFWKYFQEHGKWMPTRLLHSRIGTQKVREALRTFSGDIVRELENSPNDTYELSLIGILMTSDGENFRCLLLRYLEFLHKQFISSPEKVDFTDNEIQLPRCF